MNLATFKNHIQEFPDLHVFKYGISAPFSWRGSYNEVAFSVTEEPMSREKILSHIEQALSEGFYGYKGGEYYYNGSTTVNFEQEGSRNYSDGGYVSEMIAKIEGKEVYQSQEDRLVKLAFA